MLGVLTKVKQVCGDQQKVENQTTGLGQHKFEVPKRNGLNGELRNAAEVIAIAYGKINWSSNTINYMQCM